MLLKFSHRGENSGAREIGTPQGHSRSVQALLEELPVLPDHISRLNAILGSTPVDLKQIEEVAALHPKLVADVVKLCNSSLFELSSPVSGLGQAVGMIGSAHLRSLLLTCALVEYVGGAFTPAQQHNFWQHGFLTAAISEGIARRSGYPDVEQAYFAGLLHDVGVLPLLKAESAAPAESPTRARPAALGLESVEAERQLFGTDHCELGHFIGVLWGFPRPLIDVFAWHHLPEKSSDDRLLTTMVSAADAFCRIRTNPTPRDSATHPQPGPTLPTLDVLSAQLGGGTYAASLAAMEADYVRMTEWLKIGFSEPFLRDQ